MKILGINWGHNSTAALWINGEIVLCSSEERFSNIKNDERYPFESINWMLKETELDPDELDLVVFDSNEWSPTRTLTRYSTSFKIEDFVLEQHKVWKERLYYNNKVSILKEFASKIDFEQFPGEAFWEPIVDKWSGDDDHITNEVWGVEGKDIRSAVVFEHLGIEKEKIKFIDHHLGHAAYSYFATGAVGQNALICTIDGYGDGKNYTASTFDSSTGNFTEIVSGSNFILGRLWRYLTLILGMKPNEHEFKVMGIAPYSKYHYHKEIVEDFLTLQKVDNLHFKDVQKPLDLYFQIKEMLEGKRFDNISGGLQTYTEENLKKWISNLIEYSGIDTVCLGGGVAMNVKANQALSQLPSVKELWVPASPDDSSQAMGAIFAYVNLDSKERSSVNKLQFPSVYLGHQDTGLDLETITKYLDLNEGNFRCTKNDVNRNAAKMIYSGGIVGRVSGRAEFGARALGNRSILADPSNLETKDKINLKIKNRDFWMPFAATVLQDHYLDFFEEVKEPQMYRYMTNAIPVKESARNRIIAACHQGDWTCRAQFLRADDNPDYYDLIYEFGQISGNFLILNTSFNIHGFPIVNNWQQAINVFLEGDLDGLILENFLITKVNDSEN